MKAALAALALAASITTAQAVIPEGASNQTVTILEWPFDIYTHRPSAVTCPAGLRGVMFLYHGNSRTAASSRNSGIAQGDAQCLLVVAPLFDATNFPAAWYHRAGIMNGTAIRDSAEWTTGFLPGFEQWARAEVGLPASAPSYHWGFSAGAQFLSRVTGYDPVDGYNVRRYVVASPSTWVWPSATVDAPYGFQKFTGAEVNMIRDYLALPLTVFVGALDNVDDAETEHTPEADAQGLTRLARATNFYNAGRAAALQYGFPFNWTFVVADGVDHSNSTAMAWSGIASAFFNYQALPPTVCFDCFQ